MKIPVCNGDQPARRLTLQIDSHLKNRDFQPEKNQPYTSFETAGTTGDPQGGDKAAVFAGTG
jgi:hypothetical protein